MRIISGSQVPAAETHDKVRLALLEWLAKGQEVRWGSYKDYRDYYEGDQATQLSRRMRQFLQVRAEQKFCANVCAPVVDALVDRLTITGFQAGDERVKEALAEWWAENRGDGLQDAVHLAAIRDGDAYVIAEWDQEAELPRMFRHFAYDGVAGAWARYDDSGTMLYACKRWRVDHGETAGENRLTVYYPDRVEKYISRVREGPAQWQPLQEEGDPAWPIPWVGKEGKPLGIPAFHFRNKDVGGDYGLSELKDILPLQDAVNKTLIDILASGDTTGFQMYWTIGVDSGPTKVSPGGFVTIPDKEARTGIYPAADMRGLLEAWDKLVMAVAGISGTPLWYFLPMQQPPSGEALKVLEARLVSKAKDRHTNFGNVWENVMRMGLRLQATWATALPETDDISCQWKDPETRSEESHMNSLRTKAELGVPEEQLWSEMGYSQEDIERMKRMRREARAEQANLGAELMQAFEAGHEGEEGI